MVRVRVGGKIKELKDSESSMSNKTSSSSSEYETDTEPENEQKEKKYRRKKTAQRKRKNTRCRSQDSKHQVRSKRLRRDRRCRSHEGRLPEEEVRRTIHVKRRCSPRQKPPPKSPTKKQKGPKTPPPPSPSGKHRHSSGEKRQGKRAKKDHRSRSRTRSSSHSRGSCVYSKCRHCQRRKRPSDAQLFPEVSVFNLQLIGSLHTVIEFIFAKKKWLIIHLTDLTSKVKAVPVDFWMNDYVIKTLEGAAYVIQISLDTLDGQTVVHKYRCLSRECILIMDPVTLEKRAFWQCFAHINDIYPELLIFLDSQTFFLLDGQKNYFPGKKGKSWPRCTEAHLLPGPSKKFNKNTKFVDSSPSKSPSLSPLSDSNAIFETRGPSPQNEPLNLSRKISATTATTSSTDEEEYISGDSPSSQTANISRSPSVSSTGNPPTPTDEPYDPFDAENFEEEEDEDSFIDPQKLVDQTRAALQGLENPDNLPEVQVVAPDVGMAGDSDLMDEINMQRAIIQSLGLQEDYLEPPNFPPGASRPPSPTPQAINPFRITSAAPTNPLEPIVEISTVEGIPHPPMQSPMLRATYGTEARKPPKFPLNPPTGTPQLPPSVGPQTMALVPVKNAAGQTTMQLVPCQVVGKPMEVAPTQGVQPVNLANTLLPFVENPIPAHTGDGCYAGGSAQPYTLGKQYLTICFVMPWGARHYVRELHSDHTMKDLLLFLQSYFRRYKDIEWHRDIINLKMINPNRNLSKLPLKMKLRDAKLGVFPVIFVFHYQFLDRAP